jgi:GH15 family glucan-1,4-alpha-glucosidase
MIQEPIESYGMIGDMRTAALISRWGGIDWCCLSRFDGASVFAALLDPTRGGTWRIHPEQPGWRSTQSCLTGTNVLETQFDYKARNKKHEKKSPLFVLSLFRAL